jgi:hypothetical protein
MLAGGKADDGSTDVRVIERHDRGGDEHFTEGELDLEPPEELAVQKVDEDALLEGDLDTEAVREDDVDVDVLEISLDHLVHDGEADDVDDFDDAGNDDDTGDDGAGDGTPRARSVAVVRSPEGIDVDGVDVDDLEIEDLEDRDESLDRILRQKLAGDEEAAGDPEESAGDDIEATMADRVAVCGPDEFVCRSCFLVRSRTQIADPSHLHCHDCVA